MPDDPIPSPLPPAEEYPIDFFTNEPSGSKSDAAPPVARGKLPPPVSGDRAWPQPAKSRRASDFWALVGCNAIVFGASVCIMVLELTASRLIAAYIGSSLYTWTSVIGVVLAGISIGNYVGGWLADRYPPQKVLSWLFLMSGLLTLSVNFLNTLASMTQRPEGINWQLWVILVVAWVFFLPALSLGTISPVTASMALKRSAKTGITVGNIYAWGALGSIVGTFLTGFWLIGQYGSQQVIWMTSFALVMMGFFVAAGQRAFRAIAVFGALQLIVELGMFSSTTAEQMSYLTRNIAGIRSGWRTTTADFEADQEAQWLAAEKNDDAALVAARDKSAWRRERKLAEDEWAKWGDKLGQQLHELGRTLWLRRDDPQEYNDESDYYAINISRTRVDGDNVKELRLDHLIHSYWNPDQPAKLYYDYEQVYAAITERAASMSDRPTAVPLDSLPAGDDFLAAFPPAVKYDQQTKMLSVHGTMQFGDLRRLLSIGPHAEYWQAMFTTFEQAFIDWNKASRRDGGVILTDLRHLPDGIVFPADVGVKVHYDSVLKSLVCTGPFSLADLMELLAQGEMQAYVEAVWELFNTSRHASALFIGGGGFVFPRWIEQSFPQDPLIDVAEIDPAVKTAIEKQLGLPTEYGPPDEGKTFVRTHIGDARIFVDDQIRENRKRVTRGEPPVTYDFVYGDAFNDLSVPWHLTTKEFSEKIASLLTPRQGVYLVNIIDIYPRVKYPGESDKAGRAEAPFAGTLPGSLLPDKIPTGEFVPCRGAFKGLEVTGKIDEFRLRYTGVMSKETRAALEKLDAGGGLSAAPGSGFAGVVAELYKQSNARALLRDGPPTAVIPADQDDEVWEAAPAPYAGLQLFRSGDKGYMLGFRGVMPNDMRDDLLALPGADERFKQAVHILHRRSGAERTGQFLGRYVNTAREVFPYVYLFTSNEGEPGALRDTFIVACSLQKLDFENLFSSGGYWKTGPFAWTERDASNESHEFGEMPSVLQLARHKLLKDDFAPVDNLLAPVFVNRSSRDD